MVFPYYAKLSRKQRAIYRESDAVETIRIGRPRAIRPVTGELKLALEAEDQRRVERHAKALVTAILSDLELTPVRVKVLSARPSETWGELHGLYERSEDARSARITVWMRTAKHKRVVAFKTFLRTVLHEICHHLDYELLGLDDSFHTEGFFKRESSLLHQLLD